MTVGAPNRQAVDKQRRKGFTTCRAASYLELLSSAKIKNNPKKKDEKDNNNMKALREKQAQQRCDQQ